MLVCFSGVPRELAFQPFKNSFHLSSRNRLCSYNLTEIIGIVVTLHHADNVRLHRTLCKEATNMGYLRGKPNATITKGERPLFPIAVIQITEDRAKLRAAFGQKRTPLQLVEDSLFVVVR